MSKITSRKSGKNRTKGRRGNRKAKVNSFLEKLQKLIFEADNGHDAFNWYKKNSNTLSGQSEVLNGSKFLLRGLEFLTEKGEKFKSEDEKAIGLIYVLNLFTTLKKIARVGKQEIAEDEGLASSELQHILSISEQKLYALRKHPVFGEIWKYMKTVPKARKISEGAVTAYRSPTGQRGRPKATYDIVPHVHFHYFPISPVSKLANLGLNCLIHDLNCGNYRLLDLFALFQADLKNRHGVCNYMNELIRNLIPVTQRFVDIVKMKYPNLDEDGEQFLLMLTESIAILNNHTLRLMQCDRREQKVMLKVFGFQDSQITELFSLLNRRPPYTFQFLL